MCRSTRTLLSVFVILSLHDVFVLCQIRSGISPTPPENFQNFKSLTGQPGNFKPDFLSPAQRLLAGTHRPTLNDFSTQPFITKPPVVTIEPSYQQVPVNVNPAPNLPIPFTPTTCNTDSPVVSSPETATLETVEPTPSITVSSVTPSTFDYPNAVDQNYVPFNPKSFAQTLQTLSMPEAFYVDNFVQQPELLQFYQPPVTVQASSYPVVTPFTSYANPVSSFFPQNAFTGVRELPVVYPDTFNSQQTQIYSEAGNAPVSYGSNVLDSGSGYTVPLSLQINMPPTSEQPIIVFSPPTPAPQSAYQDTSYTSTLPPMVPPLIVMESSKSRWKNILPLLLIALCDGGCCNNSECNGCSSGCNIPIPYPIPIPTNNPIIFGQGNKKGKIFD